MQYHQDAIHAIEFTGERLIISMGLDPELLRSKKTMRLWKSIFSHLLLLRCSF
uniref:Photosystem II protein M n=1 Tax=Sinopora hongkongensis TaxID=3076337 RepID=A0A6B9MUM8_9MAGN|nr:photosystem II protein M [Sinopora hongkongensis]